MNISNISTTTTTTSLILNDKGYLVVQLFGYYVIPITAVLGAVSRLLFIIGIYNSDLMKMPKYCLLYYNTLLIGLMNVILILYQNSNCVGCPDKRYNPYWMKIYQLYIIQFVNNIVRIEIMVFETLTTFDRFCVFIKKKSFLSCAKIQIIFWISLIFATLAQIHVVFGQVIAYSEINKLYYLATTQVGQSQWFFLYQVILISVIRIGTIMFILIFNFLNFIEYKKFIRDKKKIVKDINKIKYEVTFTRMIIITTSLFAISLTFITWAYIVSQINSANKITYDSFANLVLTLGQELLLVIFISDIFLYVFMDDNLKKKLQEFYTIKK